MDDKYLWIGGGVLAVLIFASRGGGSQATIINRSDPNAAAEAAGRSEFAARGLDSLASVARADIGGSVTRYVADVSGGVSRYMADAQVRVQQSRDAAMTASARAAADAQARSATEAAKGKSGFGFSIPIPGLGSIGFGLHW